MDAGTLHAEIAKVCPVVSTVVGDPANRGTWTYEAGAAATQAQKDAAANVIATIPVEQLPAPSPPAAALYDHEARLLALEGAPASDIETYMKKRGLDGRKL